MRYVLLAAAAAGLAACIPAPQLSIYYAGPYPGQPYYRAGYSQYQPGPYQPYQAPNCGTPELFKPCRR